MARQVGRNATLEMGLSTLEAKKRLDRQKILLPTRPEDEFPVLPEDPTDLSDSALMRLFVELTKWAEYLSAQFAVAEVDERYAEAAVDKVRAIKGYDFRKPDAKQKAYEDPDFEEVNDKFNLAHAYRKMIGVAFANAERNSNLLSRELTRRVGRNDREGRVDRWSS